MACATPAGAGEAAVAALHAATPGAGAAREALVPAVARTAARPVLALRLLLCDARAQLALTQSDLAGAGTAAASVVDLLQRFPALLGGMRGGVHLLLGMYAQASGARGQGSQATARA
jgi:hypothetical protein